MSETAEGQVCAECGASFRPKRRGRPSRYCRPACRQRAWALRQAAARLAECGPTGRPELPATAAAVGRPELPATAIREKAAGPEPQATLHRGPTADPEPMAGHEPPAEPEPMAGHDTAAAPPLPATPAVATDARGWARTLSRLTAQLSDPGSELVRAPWEHLRLYDALGRALTALDAATPGGLAWLERHE